MSIIANFGLIIGLCTILSSLAYWQNVLTLGGSVTAFFVGLIIGVFGDVLWLGILLLFLVTSFVATKYKFATKQQKGVQEGVKGERGGRNVLANGAVPTVIAFLSYEKFYLFSKELAAIVFLSSIAVSAADTLASELGVLSDRTYLITTFERVRPGTNGGISVLGQFWAFIAAMYTAIIGYLALVTSADIFSSISYNFSTPFVIVIPLSIGFLGCQIDSMLGATLERSGILNKNSVNLVATASGALISWTVLLWAGI